MAHPVSLRFRDPRVNDRLRGEAAASGRSVSALAEELIDEGLRSRRHPLVVFRDGVTGRRAALMGGPEVWEVVSSVVGGDVPPEQRTERAVELFALSRAQVDAALGYYADFTDEIDGQVAANLDAADGAESRWHRQRDLLAR